MYRFRRGEPIRARPVGVWERGLKWARRRPTAAALVAVSALAAVTLLVGAAWSNTVLREAAERERRSAQAAEEAATRARELAEQAKEAAERERRLAREAEEGRQAALQVIKMQNNFGLLYQGGTQPAQAATTFRQAVAIRKSSPMTSPRSRSTRFVSGECMAIKDGS